MKKCSVPLATTWIAASGEAADLFSDAGRWRSARRCVVAGAIEEYLRRLHGGRKPIYGQLNEWVTLQPAFSSRRRTQRHGRWRITACSPLQENAEWRDGSIRLY